MVEVEDECDYKGILRETFVVKSFCILTVVVVT